MRTTLLFLIKRSLSLDWEFIQLDVSFGRKLEFLCKKYFILIKNYTAGFVTGVSFVTLWLGKYFYEDRFGISFLQSVYVDCAFLEKYISPNGVIIDIGANIGQFRHFATFFLRARRVYSFEPVLETWRLLKRNFGDHCYNYAIGNHRHHIFYIPETSLMASQYWRSASEIKKKKISEIKLGSIREICDEKSIDLLKIDTEGSELEVLVASVAVRSKTRFLLIEVSINRQSSGDITDTLSYIKKYWEDFHLVYIGRPNYIGGTVESVDLLFKNSKLDHEV